MIRALRYSLLILLGLVLLAVALANRDAVVLNALPENLAALTGFGWQVALPLYVVIFASVIAGVLIGFVWEWFREMKHRTVASNKSREAARLERELAMLRDAKGQPQDDVIALLEKKKAS